MPIDLVESMGSDIYAYFTVRGEAHSGDLDDLAKDTGQDMHGEGTQVMARLDAAANVRPGKEAEAVGGHRQDAASSTARPVRT